MSNKRAGQLKKFENHALLLKSRGKNAHSGSLTGVYSGNHPWRILIYIRKNPGLHYREIWRNLGIPKDTLSRNLRELEKQNKIKIRRKGYFKFFYPKGTRSIPFTLTPMQKNIFKIVEKGAGPTYNKIGTELDRTPENIHYHMKNLAKIGLVHSKKIDNQLHWFPSDTDDKNG